MSLDALPHWRPLQVDALESLSADIQAEHQHNESVINEFLAADVIVLGAPMYNFGVPSQLKAWIDRIAVAGRTFRYAEAGPVGMAGPKKIIIASARGGFYAGMNETADFQEAYLNQIFGFLGISGIVFVRAEGTSTGQRDASIAAAKAQIDWDEVI